jgi:hypothetical protein
VVTVNAQNPVLDQLLAQGLTRDAAGALVSGEILVDGDSVLNPGGRKCGIGSTRRLRSFPLVNNSGCV